MKAFDLKIEVPEITLEEFVQDYVANFGSFQNSLEIKTWAANGEWMNRHVKLSDCQIPENLLERKWHLTMSVPFCEIIPGSHPRPGWVHYEADGAVLRIDFQGDPEREEEVFLSTWYPMASNGDSFDIHGNQIPWRRRL
jgi:hypothetical protein